MWQLGGLVCDAPPPTVHRVRSKCRIGYHGDGERRIAIDLRLGESLPLHYQWCVTGPRLARRSVPLTRHPRGRHLRGAPVGERVEIHLDHGDVYVMSAKAVGRDWRRRTVPTLRHAAGRYDVLLKAMDRDKRDVYRDLPVRVLGRP